ncbi:GlsB/YeaQ/YmgE family stress response membrane protein [Thetidibacter halocola]|uniref:GlsB/YeaQ/YmgE family stress response membrane protein n=1 Tax=Thetidibacter halocola TaxID=2827239 RepID=A0A8J7WGY6_9RHOB|nr:GlsB/YeaQ/YmgE family stress response membrane protein [Thetidibacter halocola]MBS0124824.1 GlsB/YeaQ/YmgE family stress response membrane protein [Thetidibacter halocola]
MGIVWLIIIGAAAGFLATRFMNVQTGVVETVLIGMAGAVIGGLVLRFMLAFMGAIGGLVGAVLGAMLLIWAWKAIRDS